MLFRKSRGEAPLGTGKGPKFIKKKKYLDSSGGDAGPDGERDEQHVHEGYQQHAHLPNRPVHKHLILV